MAGSTASNVTQTITQLGFAPVNPWALLNRVTSGFGHLIEVVFAWVYFLSEIGVLAGALVWLVGSIGSHARIKRTGAHITLYAIVGFLAAVILPGVVLALDSTFQR